MGLLRNSSIILLTMAIISCSNNPPIGTQSINDKNSNFGFSIKDGTSIEAESLDPSAFVGTWAEINDVNPMVASGNKYKQNSFVPPPTFTPVGTSGVSTANGVTTVQMSTAAVPAVEIPANTFTSTMTTQTAGGKTFRGTSSSGGSVSNAAATATVGTWTVSGSVKQNTGVSGDKLTFTFTGTNILIKGYKGPGRGQSKMTVKDPNNGDTVEQPAIMIDQFKNSAETIETLAQINGLKKGLHKVEFEALHSKSAASTGYKVDFNQGFYYPAMEYDFIGERIKFYGVKVANGGLAKLYVDGVFKEDLDFYGTPGDPIVREYTGFGSGRHNLMVQSIGTKNALSTGTVINIEKVDVLPKLKTTVSGDSVGFGFQKKPGGGMVDIYIGGVFQETIDLNGTSGDTFNYTKSGLGSGNHDIEIVQNGAPPQSGGTIEFTGITINDKITYQFSGTEVKYYAIKKNDQGKVDIYLDGIKQDSDFDLYASTKSRAVIFEKTGINSGQHTLVIKPSGTKHASSSAYKLNADSFESGSSQSPTQLSGRIAE